MNKPCSHETAREMGIGFDGLIVSWCGECGSIRVGDGQVWKAPEPKPAWDGMIPTGGLEIGWRYR